ncbi:MAG: glycoside hydrolase [Oscillospiraceae bacterium]|nr:glycoside hydrolase [Oscillospiraceae bacterium]
MKRWFAMLLTLALLAGTVPAAKAADGGYTDVPADSWAASSIETARQNGLMQGIGGGRFGYGQTLTRAQFATMLCNLMQWEAAIPASPSFSDVAASAWYYGSVEAALAHGAADPGGAFRPEAAITREEMAVMFVRALGLRDAAEKRGEAVLPFRDVTANRGYIAVAYQLGIVNGKSADVFAPAATASRQEAAAMLVRVWEKYRAETGFVHGFYAISAYTQRDLAAQMDAVTYHWSTMGADGTLDTVSGDYRVPDSYESIVRYLGDTPAHLGVYMDESGGALDLLLDPAGRSRAAASILAELDRTYEAVGKNPYSGVTVDFEGLRGEAVKTAFTAFLTELSEGLRQRGDSLYVAVQPVLRDGAYYDGFDCRAIGALADKVILMAYDYQPASLAGYLGTNWQENAALTPIGQVYDALEAAVDPQTGVEDVSKLVLGLSFNAQGWEIDEAGKLQSETPVSIRVARIEEVLAAGGQRGYSRLYQNPYVVYDADDGTRLFAWYEDAESIQAKIALAKCFGVTGVSVWRLGNIPGDAACRQVLGLVG